MLRKQSRPLKISEDYIAESKRLDTLLEDPVSNREKIKEIIYEWLADEDTDPLAKIFIIALEIELNFPEKFESKGGFHYYKDLKIYKDSKLRKARSPSQLQKELVNILQKDSKEIQAMALYTLGCLFISRDRIRSNTGKLKLAGGLTASLITGIVFSPYILGAIDYNDYPDEPLAFYSFLSCILLIPIGSKLKEDALRQLIEGENGSRCKDRVEKYQNYIYLSDSNNRLMPHFENDKQFNAFLDSLGSQSLKESIAKAILHIDRKLFSKVQNLTDLTIDYILKNDVAVANAIPSVSKKQYPDPKFYASAFSLINTLGFNTTNAPKFSKLVEIRAHEENGYIEGYKEAVNTNYKEVMDTALAQQKALVQALKKISHLEKRVDELEDQNAELLWNNTLQR